MLIRRLYLDGFLSFSPGSEPFELRPLNVLIGSNGSGKSNVIEALGLLAASSRDLGQAIGARDGPIEWLWKGEPPVVEARIEAELDRSSAPNRRRLRCRLALGPIQARLELLDEAAGEMESGPDEAHPYWYYQLDQGRPVTFGRTANTQQYREVAGVRRAFSDIRTLSEWVPGRKTPRPDVSWGAHFGERMFTDGQETAVLNQMIHSGDTGFNDLLKRFYPGFERLAICDANGTKGLCLHEVGFEAPIPVARMSGGTLRFVALLATLLSPSPPPLVCVEGPERGLHPDAAGLLGEVLADASRRMQLVVTTHSSALVSALSDQPGAVVACERLGSATSLRRLDRGRLADWLDEYSLGDLWGMGVLGANP